MSEKPQPSLSDVRENSTVRSSRDVKSETGLNAARETTMDNMYDRKRALSEVGFWRKAFRALVDRVGRVGQNLADETDRADERLKPAYGLDIHLEPGLKTFTPLFDCAQKTFTDLYSTKTGKIFFISGKGEGIAVDIPRDLLILQGSKEKKDREKYRDEFAKFISACEEKYPGWLHMASGNKFQQVWENARMRMHTIRQLLERGFQTKNKKEMARDEEHLWDVLSAEDRILLLDLCMGIFGVESGFDPSVEGGLAQMMPVTLTALGMSGKDNESTGKVVASVPKLFEKYYQTLKQKNGAVDVISRYGLKDGNFLVYALVDSYHAGGGNVLALCRALLEEYPNVADLPSGVRANSEEIYTFMTHRGHKGSGTYGPYSTIYVPQVSAMAGMLKRPMAARVKKPVDVARVASPKKTR